MAFRLNVYEQNQANAYRDALDRQRQAEEAQRQAYDRAMQAQANAQQAQNKQVNPLEAVLSGIGDAIKNTGDTLYNMAGTGGAALRDLFTGNAGTGKYQNEWKDYMKKSQYGDENLSDKDYYLKTGGKAVDAAATISDLIPVVGQGNALVKGMGKAGITGMNIAQGVASGAVNPLIENGSQATLEDVLRGGVVGGAGATAGQYVGGKLANRVPGTSRLSKIVNSNVGRGALTGAASGAVAGGLNAGLTGNDVLQGTLQGAKSGGLGGAAMAGTMGVLGKGIEKLQNKYGANTPATPTVAEAPTKPIAQNVVEDTTPSRRNIPITDYDAGAQRVGVRRNINVQGGDNGAENVNVANRTQKASRKLIDGVISPDNEVKLPNTTKRYDKTAIDIVDSGKFDDPIETFRRMGIPEDTIRELVDKAESYADMNNEVFNAYGLNSKSELPMLNRKQYYEDNLGQLTAKGGNGNIRAEDVEDYMYNHLRESAGTNYLGGAKDDNWTILHNLFGDRAKDWSMDDMYDAYRSLAKAQSVDPMSSDNLAFTLAGEPELNAKLTQDLLDKIHPRTQINVGQAPGDYFPDKVNVRTSGQLIQDVTPGRAQANPTETQYTKRVINPNPETPTQARPAIRRATEMPTEQQINPNLSVGDRAKYERQLTVNRQRQGAALLEQYGTLDKPVRRAVGSPEEVLSTLYDEYGLTTPADVQYAANHVTGRDGVVSQMTRELAGKAQNVDTRIDKKWLDNIMDLNGLDDKEAKAVTNQIAAALKRTSANGFTDGNTTLDTVKQLEAQASRYKGKDGTYHNATPADKAKGAVIDLVRDELQARIWDAAGDASSVVTPQRLQQLKDMYPGNQKWANFVDGTIANVKTGGDLRHTMKPLVDGSKIVNGSKMAAGGYADRAYKAATSRNPIVAGGQIAMDMALDSDFAKQKRADRYARKAAKAEAKLTGTDYVDPTTGRAKTSGLSGTASELWQGTKKIAGKAGKKVGNVWDTLNNDTFSGTTFKPLERNGQMQTLGDIANRQLYRQAGLGAMRAQDAERDMQNANMDMQNALQDYNNASNDMFQAQNYMQNMQQQSAGNGQLDRISQAMDAALMAGDISSYSKLADLYKQALSIYQLQNPTATTSDAKALNATQAKAVTGLSQLQQLAAMQPGARTALSNSPLSGFIDLTGGDSYNSQADSLASTIGYLLSGANIKDDEIEAVKRDYIPSTFDSPTVRQQKLSRAEQLLRNYLADTNALTAL